MEDKYIIDENLKNEIKLRLRTFSQLQTKYKKIQKNTILTQQNRVKKLDVMENDILKRKRITKKSNIFLRQLYMFVFT